MKIKRQQTLATRLDALWLRILDHCDAWVCARMTAAYRRQLVRRVREKLHEHWRN